MVPNQLSVRVYETEESFDGRQRAIPANGLFFPFRFWSMARAFLVFGRRRWIAIQAPFRSGARIPNRSGARTSKGDGGFRGDYSYLRVACGLHDCDCCKVAQQWPPAGLIVWLVDAYCLGFGQRNSFRYSGDWSGANPWRLVFSVTTRGTRKCKR